jgi:hypothetical protein
MYSYPNQHCHPKETIRVLYPRYHGLPIMTQNFEHDQLLPATNGWGTIHAIPDMTSPLQAKEEGPLTKKELIPGATTSTT